MARLGQMVDKAVDELFVTRRFDDHGRTDFFDQLTPPPQIA